MRRNTSALGSSPVFWVLWAAMLASATGTFFLLLTVSTHLLAHFGSGLLASSVFGFQWALPILLMGLVRRICEGARLRRTVVGAELAGGVVSLAIGALLDLGLVVPMLIAFLVRGLLEAITKTARVLYVRQLFDGPSLRLASYTFNNSYYIGGALGGALGSLLAGNVSIITAAAIDAATFVISACCYRWLPTVSAPQKTIGPREGMWRSVRSATRGRRQLALSLMYFIVTVGVFQGYHNVARTTVPIRVLHLDETAAMNLQIVSAVALILGSLAVPALLHRIGLPRYLPVALTAATAALAVLVPLTSEPGAMYGLYFGFMLLFEFSFTVVQADMIQNCPPPDLVALTAFTSAAGNGLLVAITLIVGGLSDLFAFSSVALMLAIFAVSIVLAAEMIARRVTLQPAE